MKLFRFISLSLVIFGMTNAFADLRSHLKNAPNKGDTHTMRNIDFIYMLNLDQRPEKWQASIEQLKPFAITPYRFSAVNGWELTVEDINDVGLKFSPGMGGGFWGTSYLIGGNFEPHHSIIQNHGQVYFCHCMSRGAIGIALSHISILKDAYESGYETVWVMEDDVDVLQDPRVLSDLIDKLDSVAGRENWDVLFTDRDIRDVHGNHKESYWAALRPDFSGPNNYGGRYFYGSDFMKIGSRWGAHSMIVRRSGMKKLLDFFYEHQIFMPYDMDYIFPVGINLFAVLNDVVSNSPKAVSDNGGPNYLNKN